MSHHTPTAPDAPDSDDARVSGSGFVADRTKGHYFLVLALLVLLVELTGLTYTMVTPALTGIAGAFHSPDIGWIMTAVTLVGAVSYAVFGKAGDILGKRKVAVGVTGVFTVGSVLSAIAPTIGVLIAGRALQGVGVCALALVYGLIRDLFPKRLVPVALGFIGAGFGLSPIIGPIIGGYLIDTAGFRGVFWFLAVYSAVIGALVWSIVPETPLRHRVRMDWVGVLILSLGALALMFGVGNAGSAGWVAPLTLLGVLGGVALLVLWVVYERRPAEPLIDTELLKQRRVAGTLVASFVVQFGLGGSSMLLPMFVMAPESSGYGFGVSALEAAVYVVAGGVAGAVAGPLAGLAGRRVGPRVTLSVGIVALLVGSLSLALVHGSSAAVMVGQFVVGIGIGACSASLPNMIVQSVPAEVQGISGGMMTLSGSIGSAISTQLMGVFLLIPVTQKIAGEIVYGEFGFTLGFLVIAGLALAGLVAMALAGARPSEPVAEQPAPVPSGAA